MIRLHIKRVDFLLCGILALAWGFGSWHAIAADSPATGAAKKYDPTPWEKEIARFEAADQKDPPKKGQVLFIGSSSIRLWDLRKSFPHLDAINRGFGGSKIEDSTYFADRIALPYEPRLVVTYAGDNDIAGGKSPQQVADDFKAFVAKVRGKQQSLPVIYVAIKPSIARWKLVDKVREANKLIREFCEKGDKLTFLDIEKIMLGDDGKPKPELFQKDGLHLNADGYKLWNELLAPHLK